MTDVQRNLLRLLAFGDQIRYYGTHSGSAFWLEAITANGDDILTAGRIGKRGLTLSTIKALTKAGYFDYSEIGLGLWTRTSKGIQERQRK